MNSAPAYLLTALALGLGAGWTCAQAPPLLEATIKPSTQISFDSDPGAAYKVEGTANGTTWQQMGETIWGDGTLMTFNAPTAGWNSPPKEFRVTQLDVANVGLAVVNLAGKSISLNDRGAAVHLMFLSADRGVMHNAANATRGFDYTVRRTGFNSARLELVYQSFTEVIDLNFQLGKVGSFHSWRFAAGAGAPDDEAGSFALNDQTEWKSTGGAPMPVSLNGTTWALDNGGQVTRLVFGESSGEVLIPGQPARSFTYSYDLLTATKGELTLDYGAGHTEYLILDLLSPSSGLFQSIRRFNGTTQSTSTGSFSKSAPPASPVTGIHECPAPNSLENDPLSMSSESETAVYTFDTTSSGQKEVTLGGSIQFTPYSYSYTRIDDLHGRIVISYPTSSGDLIEKIDLTYNDNDDCSGTYVKQRYENGVAVGPPSTGHFGPGASAGFGGGGGGGGGVCCGN